MKIIPILDYPLVGEQVKRAHAWVEFVIEPGVWSVDRVLRDRLSGETLWNGRALFFELLEDAILWKLADGQS